nr:hypothetical protein [Tanacetum cinerariifolium]
MNINNDVMFASNTPIGEKINKIERKIGKGKLRLLDNDGNPLVPMSIVEKGYNTNSLLEQWTDSYPNNDDYDLMQYDVKWIKNEAKASIYGFVKIKSVYYSKSRQSREKSPSMPLERAQKTESNDYESVHILKRNLKGISMVGPRGSQDGKNSEVIRLEEAKMGRIAK